MPQSPAVFDTKQTQAVFITLQNGTEATFYGPFQLPQHQLHPENPVVSVQVSAPVKLANGLAWMLAGPEPPVDMAP
jgi:hypothetical protein